MAPALVLADTQLAAALNAHRRPRQAPFDVHFAAAVKAAEAAAAADAAGLDTATATPPTLDHALAARPRPPVPPLPIGLSILRVGVGWVQAGVVQVEVIDIKQTMISDQRFGADDWGFELVTASRGPWQGQPPPGPGPPPVPASVWCLLFPWASFCNV
jgi:hypothetical protein